MFKFSVKVLGCWLVGWVVGWLVGLLVVGWVVGWLVGLLVVGWLLLVGWLGCWLGCWLVGWVVGWLLLVGWLGCWLVGLLVGLFSSFQLNALPLYLFHLFQFVWQQNLDSLMILIGLTLLEIVRECHWYL